MAGEVRSGSLEEESDVVVRRRGLLPEEEDGFAFERRAASVESSSTPSRDDEKKRTSPTVRTMNDPMALFGRMACSSDSAGEDDDLDDLLLCDGAVPLGIDTIPLVFEVCFRVGRCIIDIVLLLSFCV